MFYSPFHFDLDDSLWFYGNSMVAGGFTYGVWEDLKLKQEDFFFMIPDTQRYSLIEDFYLIVKFFSESNRDLEDFRDRWFSWSSL